MRIAVIADIHGNLEAFASVLRDINRQQVDSVISLGDNVGYGADSEKVIQFIRKFNIISILGNHELAVNNLNVRKWFRLEAREALNHVLESLSTESMQYILGLKKNYRTAGGLFVHGFPPDSARFYLFQISDDKILETFQSMEESICFVGHTHKLSMVYPEDGRICSQPLKAGQVKLDKNLKYIINVGSVGQPRDDDLHAKYVIWDTSAWDLDVRSIAYDNASAADKIINAGIPEKYAFCLTGKMS